MKGGRWKVKGPKDDSVNSMRTKEVARLRTCPLGSRDYHVMYRQFDRCFVPTPRRRRRLFIQSYYIIIYIISYNMRTVGATAGRRRGWIMDHGCLFR